MREYTTRTFLLLTAIIITSATREDTVCQKILNAIKEKKQSNIEKYVGEIEGGHSECVLQLFPRYFWAQNMSHILVKFQFLNSADTSACQKEVSHNKIFLSLVCLQSNLILRYRIAVTTFMPLNFYHAVWKEGQQNTIILECMKSPNPYFWKSLYLIGQVPLRKPRVWWGMVEKYLENMKKFIYDLEVEEQEIDISHFVKKKRKNRSKQQKQLDPFSKKYFYCNQNNPLQLGSWL